MNVKITRIFFGLLMLVSCFIPELALGDEIVFGQPTIAVAGGHVSDISFSGKHENNRILISEMRFFVKFNNGFQSYFRGAGGAYVSENDSQISGVGEVNLTATLTWPSMNPKNYTMPATFIIDKKSGRGSIRFKLGYLWYISTIFNGNDVSVEFPCQIKVRSTTYRPPVSSRLGFSTTAQGALPAGTRSTVPAPVPTSSPSPSPTGTPR